MDTVDKIMDINLKSAVGLIQVGRGCPQGCSVSAIVLFRPFEPKEFLTSAVPKPCGCSCQMICHGCWKENENTMAGCAPIPATQEAMPHLTAPGASIILISSVTAYKWVGWDTLELERFAGATMVCGEGAGSWKRPSFLEWAPFTCLTCSLP